MLFRQVFDPKLAQYAYLIGCQQTGEALLIDPERDIDQYLELAEEEGVEIVAVAETHIHADFLSGAREFAERFDTTLYLSDEGTDDWKYEWVKEPKQSGGSYDAQLLKDGDTFTIGNIEVEAVHTPGHTPEHMSFMITDKGGGATEPMGIVTGDFAFVNDLGRPDLLESAAKVEGVMEPSARELYRSVQRFLDMPDYLQVWPAHGAGSTCGKALGAVPQTTIGYERKYNPMVGAALEGEDRFVDAILDGQPEPQLYFARMKRDNKLGAPVLGQLPQPKKLTVQELKAHAENDESLLVDTRIDRSAFMETHIPGALYAPMNKSFNTVIGSLVEDETTPIVLLIDEDDVDEAVRDLVRIGYDNPVAFASLETLQRYLADAETTSIEEIDFAELEQRRHADNTAVVDVRFRSEYDAGHVEGAHNASYTRLPEYEADLPTDETLIVHCGSGARAAAASAYLQRSGRSVVYVNDNFSDYEAPVTSGDAVAA